MLEIDSINMPISYQEKDLMKKVAHILNVKETDILSLLLVKKSIDARKKDALLYVLKVNLELKKGVSYNKKMATVLNEKEFVIKKALKKEKIVIVGDGPSGLFAGLVLARSGLHPLIIERGMDAKSRLEAYNNFLKTGQFNPKGNAIFGEGGAGTFSDGKLTTNLKDPMIHFILEEFVKHGAPQNVLYDAKPHIGTDILVSIVENMRNEIEQLGGKFLFETTLTNILIKNGTAIACTIVRDEKEEKLSFDKLILALGHSSRDTFEMLYQKEMKMEPKAFSMGVRIEHPRKMIDNSQYGPLGKDLPSASYKLATHLDNGRGVYTFCMCPGGMVIPANSIKETLCINGMSYNARDLENSNSALLVDVRPEDYGADHPLNGFLYQEKYERLAYQSGNSYRAPVQKVGDFLKDQPSVAFGSILPSYPLGTHFYELKKLLPDYVTESLKKGIIEFGRKIKGFDHPDALLTGIETRSSSPVRLERNEDFESNIFGLFPIGEGAGYAGGITSSALDGIKCALKIIERNGKNEGSR